MKREHGKNIMAGIWVAAAFWFLVLIYAPLELYFNNKEEFWFDFWVIFPVMGGVFLAAELVSVLILWLCGRKPKLYDGIVTGGFAVYLATYIQGTFCSGNLPPLDGTSIVWSEYSAERIKTILIWVVCVLGVVLLARKVKKESLQKGIRIVSICMTLMLAVTAQTLGIANQGFESKEMYFVTTEGELEFSKEENFIILLLDAVDSRTFSELLAEHTEWQDTFQDFTFYEDAMGTYSYTKHAIPFILSGEWYENERSFKNYLEDVYESAPLFDELEGRGYRMNLYESEMVRGEACARRFDNAISSGRKLGSLWDFVRWQIQMSGYRYAPFDLKRICFVNPNAFNTLKCLPEQYEVFTEWNTDFYADIRDGEVTEAEEKNFKFIHIEGAHVPFRYNAEVEQIDTKEGTYEQNVEAAITIADCYLERMKEAGVYDNSIIMVMADHGYDKESTLARTCPLLLVKGKGEQHPLVSSSKPISYADLQEAYAELLSGAQGEEVFSKVQDTPRTRRYVHYEYNEDEHMWEYEQTGKARDTETLLPTGEEYIYNGSITELDASQSNLKWN